MLPLDPFSFVVGGITHPFDAVKNQIIAEDRTLAPWSNELTKRALAPYRHGDVLCSRQIDQIAKRAVADATTIDFGRDPAPRSLRKDAGPWVHGAETVQIMKLSGKTFPDGTEHVAVGIVLEPTLEMNQPDTQGDVYSAAEVAAAEAKWKANYGTIGLQHKEDITKDVDVVQSWITPVDVQIGGQTAVAGSWLLAVRFNTDELWKQVQSGQLTGFSIGGTATRVPRTT